MTKPPAPSSDELASDSWHEPSFEPLSAEQAQRLREQLPQVSPWRVVGAQLAVGPVAALIAWVSGADKAIGWSLLYGAWAVALPAGLYARAVVRGAGAGFLLWELVKLVLTVALLAAAPKVVPGLNWLALVAGVILATKMYWVALAWMRRPRRTGK
ncbi:ATP synthase subunit I [Ramlibacter sp. AN1015]|uniref:ATP synthase subunit I n=1 Tax=Ramlibacter sp. AN1015 TaxID=3133428 RepID=UPI0030BAB788